MFRLVTSIQSSIYFPMAKRREKTSSKKKRRIVSSEENIPTFKDGSFGTHIEQEKKMKHKDFPLFLRMGYEEVGEKINN